jgi:hypothetical protein
MRDFPRFIERKGRLSSRSYPIHFENDVSYISTPHPHICTYFSNYFLQNYTPIHHSIPLPQSANRRHNGNEHPFQPQFARIPNLLSPLLTTIALFILTMSVVGWITGLATFPTLLETSITALVAAAIVILCRLI